MPRLSNNPTNESRRGSEYEISSLPLGSYFETRSPFTDELIINGFLMDVCIGRVVVFPTGEGDGNFDGEGEHLRRATKLNELQNFAPETPVVWLGVDEEVRAAILEARSEKERVSAEKEEAKVAKERVTTEAIDPMVKAIRAQWEFYCRQLQIILSNGESTQPAAGLREKLNSIAAAAEARGMKSLPSVPEELDGDEAFFGLEEMIVKRPDQAGAGQLGKGTAWTGKQSGGSEIYGGVKSVRALTSIPKEQLKSDPKPTWEQRRGLGVVIEEDGQDEFVDESEYDMALGKKTTPVIEEADTTAPAAAAAEPAAVTTAPTVSKADQLKAANAARKAALAAKKGGGANGAVAGAVKEPKAKKVKTLGPCLDGCGAEVGGRFAMGHDAKLKSLLIKVERGEVAPGDIPEIAQGYIKLKKGTVETNDVGGVKTKVQTYIVTQAPVRFAGRPEINYVEKLEDGR